jgi:rare lipoprotein A (peptidoglycan hydrolase)
MSAQALARLGVAAFAVALVVPAIASDHSGSRPDVLVAAASDIRGAIRSDPSLPNQVATPRRGIVVTSSASASAAAPVSLISGGQVIVTASWYGPGFYENRLPCWQWLQTRGLPIQMLPDTWGVAHKTLPCGTLVTLTHGANTIIVPVVDRGPYVAGRELDLSPRAKAALGCTDVCTVVMQVN